MINDFVQSNELPAFIGQRPVYLDASWNMRKRMAMSEVLDGVPEIVSAEIMMFCVFRPYSKGADFRHCRSPLPLERVVAALGLKHTWRGTCSYEKGTSEENSSSF